MWRPRLLLLGQLAILSFLQPCLSTTLNLNGLTSSDGAGNDDNTESCTTIYDRYGVATWSVQLGQQLCVQGIYILGQGNAGSVYVGSNVCVTLGDATTSYSGSVIQCTSVLCGNVVNVELPKYKWLKLCELDLEVSGSNPTTASIPTTLPLPVTAPPPFYYDQSVQVQYANCAAVEAESQSVIAALSHDFFCNDASYFGYKSCAELLNAGFKQTGYYEIDPDGTETGVESFLVFCDMCTTTTTECPADHTSFQQSCYKVYSDRLTRQDAAAACAPEAHLIDITKQEEQDYIAQILTNAGSGDAWMGLSSENDGEPLYWSDGSPLEYAAWDSLGRNDDQSCIRLNSGSNYGWGDIRCSKTYGYVCEFELSSSSSTEICKGTTAVDHEQLRTEAIDSKSKPGEVEIPITYKPSLQQISALTAVSDSCQQYIKYDCRNSVLWRDDWPFGWWISRQGKDMHNFGGVPTGQEGCACSLTDDGCSSQGMKCNCDTENDDWYKDDGLLTDKGTLPVTKLRFGDTKGGSEEGKYTLGPLECNGIESPPKKSCAELWSNGERMDMEYEIDPDGPGGIGPPFKVFCNLSDAAPVLRSCEELRMANYRTDGYYDIDPDGPIFGESAFTVFCNMNTGETKISHDSETKGRVKGYEDAGSFQLNLHYMASSAEQIYNLIGISATCQQYLQYDCSKSQMYSGDTIDTTGAWWVTKDGGIMHNWGGVDTEKLGCACFTNKDCVDNNDACNCDKNDATWRSDGGWLSDKDSLPVMEVHLGDTGDADESGWYTVGPVLCKGTLAETPVYRTCAELYREGHERDGFYLLDSDGTNTGYPPYVAYCNMTSGVTIVSHDHQQLNAINVKQVGGYTSTITYQASSGQLKALTTLSKSCQQHLQFNCKDFSLWDNTNGQMKAWWVNSDGQKMNHWGGVPTESTGCACAVDESCFETSNMCNCDTLDGINRYDIGWLTDKLVLPVMELHFNENTSPDSEGRVKLGSLQCEGTDLPVLRSCAEIRSAGFKSSGWYDIDPDGAEGSLSSLNVYCNIITGATVINHDSEERRLAMLETSDQETSSFFQRRVNYKASMDQIIGLMDTSLYCQQYVKWECYNALIWKTEECTEALGMEHGSISDAQITASSVYSRSLSAENGRLNGNNYWATKKGNPSDPWIQVDLLETITVSGIRSQGSGSSEKEWVKKLKIQIGESENALTYISEDNGSPKIFAANNDKNTVVDIVFPSPVQTRYLRIRPTDWNNWVGFRFEVIGCRTAGHAGSVQQTYWMSRDGDQMVNWGGVNTGIPGCNCHLTDSCGDSNFKCNCDNNDNVWRYDDGLLIDKTKLPVSELRFGDIDNQQEMGFYTLGPLKCLGKSSDTSVLKSCAHLRDAGHSMNGYYSIDPDGNGVGVEPFAVYCDLSTGTSTISHNSEDRSLVRGDSFTTIPVQYEATFEQIAALISISSHCQQSIVYECYGSTLWDTTSNPYGHVGLWKSENGATRYNFGIGTGLQGCLCGFDGSCADPNGYCNCDADDFTWRNDSVFLTDKATLPVSQLQFGDTNNDKEKGFYTLGKLECSNKVFSSCVELQDAGYVTDGYYEISPEEMVFCNISQGCPRYRTDGNFYYQYRFAAFPDYVTSIKFSVKANNDVYIALSPEPEKRNTGDTLYEIVLGANGNTNTILRRCVQQCHLITVSTPNILNASEWRDFYVNFQNGIIQVSKVGFAPFAEYIDSSPIDVRYVGFSTGFSSEGEWEFPFMCSGFRKYG